MQQLFLKNKKIVAKMGRQDKNRVVLLRYPKYAMKESEKNGIR